MAWPYKFKYGDLTISAKAVVAEFVAMTIFVFVGCGTAVFFSRISEATFVQIYSGPQDSAPPGLTNFTETAAPALAPELAVIAEKAGTETTTAADALAQTKLLIGTLQTNGNWGITTALSFGFAIMVLAFVFGHISGGQINCMVTLALFLSGQLGPLQGVANFCAQMVGSILGAGFLYGVIPDASNSSLGANAVNPDFTEGQAFLGEAFMTFVLVLTVLMTATDDRSLPTKANLAPFAIGMAVFLGHAVLLPVDGCSINPTRSFGPAVVSGSFKNFWVFWIGPLVGALFAVAIYMFFRWPVDTVRGDDEDKESKVKVADADI